MNEVYTVGHSTRDIEDFVAVLRAHEIACIADVRRYPGSRRNPHFGRDRLAQSLEGAGIGYRFLGGALGGYMPRHLPRERSPNAAWANESFRNYADAMTLPSFRAGLEALEEQASTTPTAIMCAELDYHRCHRRILADLLSARGWNVLHVHDEGPPRPHTITSFAVVVDDEVCYPHREPSRELGMW